VVIPTQNASQTIGRTVDSVLNQTLLPDEIIFVDDCSTDSTVEVIHQHSGLSTCSNSRLLTTSTNSGPGVARNLGWNEAGSEFVAFLDADDSWHPQKLELQVAALLSHPWASFSGHRYLIDSGDSMAVLRYSKLPYREFGLVHFLLRNRFSTPSVMVSRNVKLRFGEHPGVSDDYLLWLRLLARGERALFSDAPLVHLHKAAYGDGGLSGQQRNISAEVWASPDPETIARLHRDVETTKKSFTTDWRAQADALRNVIACFGERIVVVRACDSAGEVLAIRAATILGAHAFDFLAATSSEGRRCYASNVAMHTLLLAVSERGATSYDFGGVDPTTNKGVYDFKHGAGGLDHRYVGEFEFVSPRAFKPILSKLMALRLSA